MYSNLDCWMTVQEFYQFSYDFNQFHVDTLDKL